MDHFQQETRHGDQQKKVFPLKRVLFFQRMGAAALPVIMFTLIWGGVGLVAPYFVKAGPNKRLIQTCLTLTAACCWLFWLCCYMAQMNPLIGQSSVLSTQRSRQ